MATDDEDQPQIGFTGARFGGGARRRARTAAEHLPDDSVSRELDQEESPSVGTTGARFGGATRRKRQRQPEPPAPTARPAPTPAPAATAEPVVEWPLMRPTAPAPDAPVIDEPVSVRVRPYVLTGGRTRPGIHLELETLVSAGAYPAGDHQRVVDLCHRPTSVAEVAALMEMPIGVARVVVGDLAAQGALVVHAAGVEDVPELAFLERVLSGLRRL